MVAVERGDHAIFLPSVVTVGIPVRVWIPMENQSGCRAELVHLGRNDVTDDDQALTRPTTVPRPPWR